MGRVVLCRQPRTGLKLMLVTAFDSIWFKNMLREVGDGDKTAIMTVHLLKQYLAAEWSAF